jgi:hypothetical protein
VEREFRDVNFWPTIHLVSMVSARLFKH